MVDITASTPSAGYDDYSDLELPSDTMALVQKYLDEQREEADILSISSEDSVTRLDYAAYLKKYKPLYGLSQFWYSQAQRDCPIPSDQAVLLDYDERFQSLAGSSFVKYDLDEPPRVLPSGLSSIDIAVIDPPYHSQACQVKITSFLSRIMASQPKIIVLTGKALAAQIDQIYRSCYSSVTSGQHMQLTKFQVEHGSIGNGLKNEYGCWANFTEGQTGIFAPAD